MILNTCSVFTGHLYNISSFVQSLFISFAHFLKDFIYLIIFREERNINVWLPLERPLMGTWPTTPACALTGTQTSNPLVCRPVLTLLKPHRPELHTFDSCILTWNSATLLHSFIGFRRLFIAFLSFSMYMMMFFENKNNFTSFSIYMPCT